MAAASLAFASTRRRGFSLIEVLVGLAIGLIGMLVMFRMVNLWETHTRTSTAGDDAQVAGTLAMFNLERDIKQAGLGFGQAGPAVMGCTVLGANAPMGIAFNFRLLPVEIVPGLNGAPDGINVLYGSSAFFASAEPFVSSTLTTKVMRRRNGFHPGDLAVAADSAAVAPPCALIEITGEANTDGVTLDHQQATYADFYENGASKPSRFNPLPAGVVFASGTLYNLGTTPQRNVWSINGNNGLVRTETIGGLAGVPVADSVINLRAEYGINGGNGIVNNWTAVAPADWTQVIAIRVSMLVRSKQWEKPLDPGAPTPSPPTPTVNTPRPSWPGATPFAMTAVDGGPDLLGDADYVPNNWRYYRYHVYEKVIPLRNVVWATQP